MRAAAVVIVACLALVGCLADPEAERPPRGADSPPPDPAPVPLASYMQESYHSPRHGVFLMPNTTTDPPLPAYCVAYVGAAWDNARCDVSNASRDMETRPGDPPHTAPWTLHATWFERMQANETVVAFDSLGNAVASWDGRAQWWVASHITE